MKAKSTCSQRNAGQNVGRPCELEFGMSKLFGKFDNIELYVQLLATFLRKESLHQTELVLQAMMEESNQSTFLIMLGRP